MKLRTSIKFCQAFAELPEQVQKQTREAYRQFKQDPGYQWRNGNPSGNLLIPGKLAGCQSYSWFMLSLEEAINTYFLHGDIGSLRRSNGERIKWNLDWFPIF